MKVCISIRLHILLVVTRVLTCFEQEHRKFCRFSSRKQAQFLARNTVTTSAFIYSLSFYRAMHYSAKRSIAIACRLSVCLSVCDVGGSGPHRLKIFETNCANNIFALVAQRSSTYSQGNMEKFWGENVRSTPTSITSG